MVRRVQQESGWLSHPCPCLVARRPHTLSPLIQAILAGNLLWRGHCPHLPQDQDALRHEASSISRCQRVGKRPARGEREWNVMTKWAAPLLALAMGLWACGGGEDLNEAPGGSGGQNVGGSGGSDEQPGGTGGGDGGGGTAGSEGGSGGEGQGGDGGVGGEGGEGGTEPEPFCGNGVVEGNEQCDDGESNSDEEPDACRKDCSSPRCGDGVVDAEEQCDEEAPHCVECVLVLCGNGEIDEGEQCDDGENNSNTAPDACRKNCKLPRCGDRVTDAGEQCDDGNSVATDGCHQCKLPFCGNGVVEQGEQCDDGAANGDLGTESCRTNCELPRCGDEIVDVAMGEECEDGNTDPSDDCVSCRHAFCGDGVVQAGVEICDDGAGNSNEAPNACRRNCQPARCGDGVVDAGEDCDGGPGCTAECRVLGGDCSTAIGIEVMDGSFSVQGNNRNRPSKYSLSCVTNSNAGEAIYTLTSPNHALWTIQTNPTSFDTVLAAQRVCEPAGPLLACNDTGGSGGRDTIQVELLAGESITLIVDGFGSSSSNAGDFALSGSSVAVLPQGADCTPGESLCANDLVCSFTEGRCVPNSCGDGVVVAPEQCDDGNQEAGDGCAPDCTREILGCSNAAPIVVENDHFVVTGDTSGVPSEFGGHSCRNSAGANGEAIYRLTATEDSRWVVRTVAPTLFDSIIAVQEICEPGGTYLACNDGSASKTTGGDQMTFELAAGQTVYLIIDGYHNTTINAGIYTIEGNAYPLRDLGGACTVGASPGNCVSGLVCNVHSATCEQPVCGDGVVSTGEQCDDGNTTGGDGCSATCRMEGDSCSEPRVLTAVNGRFSVTDRTTGRTDAFDLTCADTLDSPDVVYQFTAPQAGHWVFTITDTDFDAALALRSSCSGTDLGCMDHHWFEGETVEATLAAGQTIYLIVDGVFDWEWWGPVWGNFTLEGVREP